MLSFLLLSVLLGVVSAALNNATDFTGTIVGARFRCEGLYCPQWALDVTRYDPVKKVGVEYTFDLAELLPLAPTQYRSGLLRTSFDAPSRIYSVVAADYPEVGVDSFWSLKISDDVTTSTPVITNMMVGHPDASVGSPGSIHLIKLLAGPNGRTLAVFSCGGIHEVDTVNKKYNKLGNLFGTGSNTGYTVTDAHVIDGVSLKSFVKNNIDGETYLIVSDVSSVSAATSGPLVLVQRPDGYHGEETPVAAHMFTVPGATSARLMLLERGSFDYFEFVDETTGAITLELRNLADSTSMLDLECFESLKECDFWQTSCVDPVSASIFFQAHDVATDDAVVSIGMMQYTTSILTDVPYAVSWVATEPMQFGFYGYQWVPYV